jgi:deoxyribonuclease-4
MPYLPNIASPNDLVHGKSVDALGATLRRCRALGIRHLVTHLGSDLGKGKEVGFARAVKAVGGVRGRVGDVAILLENEAGQRNSIGSKLEDLVVLRDRMAKEAGVGVGFCLDTCHVFEAGYDIRKKEVVSEIFDSLGSDNIKVIHLNDAKFELGRGLDRHENIGMGFIGKDGLRTFLNHKEVRGKPLIMETPMMEPGTGFDEMALVKSMIGTSDG